MYISCNINMLLFNLIGVSVKIFNNILLIVIITSCSLFQSSNNSNITPYLTGKNLDQNTSLEEIKANLTKIGYLAGGQYEVEVIPITLPSMTAEALELQKLRGLTNAEYSQILNIQKNKYINNKVCIQLNFNIIKFEQVSHLKDWKAEIIDSFGNKYLITWMPEDLRKMPIATLFNGLYGKEMKWYNNATGCVNLAINLDKGFKVKLTPSFVQWPFSSSTILTWGNLSQESYQTYRKY